MICCLLSFTKSFSTAQRRCDRRVLREPQHCETSRVSRVSLCNTCIYTRGYAKHFGVEGRYGPWSCRALLHWRLHLFLIRQQHISFSHPFHLAVSILAAYVLCCPKASRFMSYVYCRVDNDRLMRLERIKRAEWNKRPSSKKFRKQRPAIDRLRHAKVWLS
jgi:hypothetical protein